MSEKYYAGMDVGSHSTETVIIDDNKQQLSFSIIDTGLDGNAAAEDALNLALAKIGINGENLKGIVATGYGRANVTSAGKQVTEITCHATGAHHIYPQAGTVIDMGGQDSKVIHIDENGQLVDFVMNDKCAAGTGRFLEVMAKRLGSNLDQFGNLALLSEQAVPISNTCTVFAESEVVSLLAKNHPRDQIIRGLHQAIVDRIWAQSQTVGIHGAVIMTGGVALNQGVIQLLEDKLKCELLIPPQPQIVGALGAALIARRNFR